jgi:hypothetical protein
MYLYSFKYAGGSHPGKTRHLWSKTAFAVGGSLRTVEGLDLDEMEFRRFSTNKISNAKLLKHEKLDISLVPTVQKQLIEAFEQQGKRAFYDTASKHVVAFTAATPTNVIKYGADGFAFCGKQQTVILRRHTFSESVLLYVDGKRYDDPTVEEVISALQTLI